MQGDKPSTEDVAHGQWRSRRYPENAHRAFEPYPSDEEVTVSYDESEFALGWEGEDSEAATQTWTAQRQLSGFRDAEAFASRRVGPQPSAAVVYPRDDPEFDRLESEAVIELPARRREQLAARARNQAEPANPEQAENVEWERLRREHAATADIDARQALEAAAWEHALKQAAEAEREAQQAAEAAAWQNARQQAAAQQAAQVARQQDALRQQEERAAREAAETAAWESARLQAAAAELAAQQEAHSAWRHEQARLRQKLAAERAAHAAWEQEQARRQHDDAAQQAAQAAREHEEALKKQELAKQRAAHAAWEQEQARVQQAIAARQAAEAEAWEHARRHHQLAAHAEDAAFESARRRQAQAAEAEAWEAARQRAEQAAEAEAWQAARQRAELASQQAAEAEAWEAARRHAEQQAAEAEAWQAQQAAERARSQAQAQPAAPQVSRRIATQPGLSDRAISARPQPRAASASAQRSPARPLPTSRELPDGAFQRPKRKLGWVLAGVAVLAGALAAALVLGKPLIPHLSVDTSTAPAPVAVDAPPSAETPSAKPAESPEIGFSVDSNPPGAHIWVDGQATGLTTPARVVQQKPGEHTVLLELQGYLGGEQNVTVPESGVATLPRVELRALPAANARRTGLSSSSRSRSSASDDDDAPAVGRRASASATDAEEEPPARRASPTGTGVLRLNSRPWTKVFIDDRYVGNTPQFDLRLPAGKHTVRIVNDELGMSRILKIDLSPGETVTRVENLSD